MPAPDVTMIKTMLVMLENTLTAFDKASAGATALLSAQMSGKPLSLATLMHYEEQLATLSDQRAHMRTVIAKWWALMEDGH